jgi:spermidine synthase
LPNPKAVEGATSNTSARWPSCSKAPSRTSKCQVGDDGLLGRVAAEYEAKCGSPSPIVVPVTAEDRTDRPVVVERVRGTHGELVLRRRGPHFEVISDGVFLMDTRDGRSERLLVRAALQDLTAPARVLIGGLGVGFSLAEALVHDRVAQVTVVEREAAVVRWHATHLAAFSAGGLGDPRVRVLGVDLVGWLRRDGDRYDAICLDIDNGPGWTVSPGNARLYDDEGLAALRRRLRPGGALTVWSAHASPPFRQKLARHFAAVDVLPVPVGRGEPDLVYLARDTASTAPSATAAASPPAVAP